MKEVHVLPDQLGKLLIHGGAKNDEQETSIADSTMICQTIFSHLQTTFLGTWMNC